MKMKDTKQLCKKLGYFFKDPGLLTEAFQHSSYVNERKDEDLRDNERLEFLGDAVLDLAISHILMETHKNAKEGDLSKYRALVVNEKGLYQIAKNLDLGGYLLLGKGEELTEGREKPSILANTMEAFLGALYLDAGFNMTKEIIRQLFLSMVKDTVAGRINNDYKSMLQEHTQEAYKSLPEYHLIEESGLAHDKTFRVALQLKGDIIAEGTGKSKKEAEQAAAREAFYCLSKDLKNL